MACGASILITALQPELLREEYIKNTGRYNSLINHKVTVKWLGYIFNQEVDWLVLWKRTNIDFIPVE